VNKFQAGAATRSDTLTATVDLGNGQLALLQANANLATAQANSAGRSGSTSWCGRCRTRHSRRSPIRCVSGRSARLLAQVQQAAADLRTARALVTAARSQFFPTVSMSYSNGYTGLDAPWSTTQSYVNNWSLRSPSTGRCSTGSVVKRTRFRRP